MKDARYDELEAKYRMAHWPLPCLALGLLWLAFDIQVGVVLALITLVLEGCIYALYRVDGTSACATAAPTDGAAETPTQPPSLIHTHRHTRQDSPTGQPDSPENKKHERG